VGKRSSFERIPRDFYPTPAEAVVPLVPHLATGVHYLEPCVGDGALIMHLSDHGILFTDAWDIEPRGWGDKADATTQTYPEASIARATHFITNPPWSRDVLHPIILNLSRQLPTWLLFDADWMHTRQSTPFMPYLRKIVSVGRVKWIPDSKMTGKDNCCWYLFDQTNDAPTQFVGRNAIAGEARSDATTKIGAAGTASTRGEAIAQTKTA
jgi:hypothetical protein